MTRKLASDELALWRRVAATVTPLRPTPVRIEGSDHPPLRHEPRAISPTAAAAPVRRPATQAANTLDGSWDRRLARGLVRPDRTIDLHGHSLASAHALLDERLGEALAGGVRLVLLVTGKPPQSGRAPAGRGAIRAAVADWLAASRHSGEIAAVRNAHPRHGGGGALYLVLRRKHHRHREKS